VRAERKFRFGVAASYAESLTAWRDLARKVEDLGYSLSLWERAG
jgi:hypothetical protein